MYYITTDGVLLNGSKYPVLSGGKWLKRIRVAPGAPAGGGGGGSSSGSFRIAVNELLKTTLSVSYTKPAGTTSFTVQRDTNSGFSAPTTIYTGTSQIVEQTGLTENTTYYYRVKATSATGDTTWISTSCKTFWTPTAASQGGHRIATSSDLALDPFINVGDYLIVGSDSYAENGDAGAGVGGYNGLLIPALAAGKKVCIMGGTIYDYITLDMSNNVGTSSARVVITNIGGQVKGRINFNNFRYVKFTGKYDPVAKTGNVNFKGFDGDWSSLCGSFGFYAKGRYDQDQMILSHVGGNTDNSIVEYVESGEGGYSGMTIKNDNGTVPMTGMVLQYCYTHDCGGEGYYIGSTQDPPQMPVVDFEIHNCVVARAGLNGLQIGNMKGHNYIHNNVIVNSGFEWNNAFMKFQDQAVQLAPRENGFEFLSNLVAGTAGDFLNWFMKNENTETDVMSTVTNVNNNLFTDSRSHGAGYLTPRNTFRGTTNFNNNYIGGMAKSLDASDAYKTIFYQEATHNYLLGIESYDDGKLIFNPTGNTYDSSFAVGSTFATVNNSSQITVNAASNTRVTNINTVTFNNYMDGMIDFDYSACERWMDAMCTKWVNNPPDYVYGYSASREQTQFSVIREANATTSTNSITIPTTHPTRISLTIGTGFSEYITGHKCYIQNDTGHTFNATVVSYNSSTGALVVDSNRNTGTGTFTSWSVKPDIDTIIIRRTYNINEIVRHNGRFYKSLHANNLGNQPTGNTDSHWQLIIWSNGGTMPPDDVRIPAANFYSLLGIGLTATV